MAKVPKQKSGVGSQVPAAKWRSGLGFFPQKLGIADIPTRLEVLGPCQVKILKKGTPCSPSPSGEDSLQPLGAAGWAGV